MKRRMLSVLLAVLLAVALLCPTLPEVRAEEDGDDRLVAALKEFFAGAEGDYGAVNPNDGGAPSLGLLQWHGPRALELLRFALAGWPGCGAGLSGALRGEIADPDTDWRSRCLTAAEAEQLSALLSSVGGRAAQDALARRDILGYLALCRGWGMGSDATLFYYAVIVNQFGAGGAAVYLRHIRVTLGLGEDAVFADLRVLHQAVHDTKSYGQRYLAMRDRSYAWVLALGWPLGPAPIRRRLPPPGSPLSSLGAQRNWRLPGDFVLPAAPLQHDSDNETRRPPGRRVLNQSGNQTNY